MNQIDIVLKTYAKSGMRTPEDWASSGRDIVEGAVSRAQASLRGVEVALYSRDQTRMRPKVVNN
jgi:hypothetical protein